MSEASIRHVIVDRDGVLNREAAAGWLSDVDQWEWEPGSLEALRRLARAGKRISLVTNQSGVGRGVVSRAAVDGIHDWLRKELEAAGVTLAGIFVCPHAPEADCDCRKPRPGLVAEAVARAGIPASETILVGDDLRDLAAGRAAGLRVALVRSGKGAEVEHRAEPNTLVFENLLEAVIAFTSRDQDGA